MIRLRVYAWLWRPVMYPEVGEKYAHRREWVCAIGPIFIPPSAEAPRG